MALDQQAHEENKKCIYCGSTDLKDTSVKRKVWASINIAGQKVMMGFKIYKCNRCNTYVLIAY